jgi:cytoplasmic iron level regulating protein YaaA (DUF328/UPF0246 family)
MARTVVVLLPPSEGKTNGGTGSWAPDAGRFPLLADARRNVAAALSAAMADLAVASRITGVRGARDEQAREANLTTSGGPVLPAWQRYSGVVWEHLDPATLHGAARRRARSALVVSALGGVWSFDDPVPDYKCAMSSRLPGLGPLAAYWRRHSAPALAEACAGAVVWDLLPSEHGRAVDLGAATAARVIRVEPMRADGRAVGHNAKAAKGRFARHVLESGPAAVRPEVVASFAWPGWIATMDKARVTLLATS